MPPEFLSLWAWLAFTKTCLARWMIFLTGDWPVLSPEQQLHIQNEHHPANWPLEGNLKEQEGEHLWRWFSIDHWQQTSKTQLWTWQAAFESSAHFYQEFMVYLGKIFFSFSAPGIWFDRTFHRWHSNSHRFLLHVDIYGTCIFISAWCYSTWQPLILAPLIPEEF